MKKIFLILLLATTVMSCNKLRTAQLEDEVRDDIAENFRGSGVWVGDVELMHVEGNMYTGVVELTYDGDTYEHALDVVCDGDMFVWEVYE